MIKVQYDSASQAYDLVEGPLGNLACDTGLTTPILLSLLTDARVGSQRGWWGAQYARSPEVWGSTLWADLISPRDAQYETRVRESAERALAWLPTSGLVSGVRVSVTPEADRVVLTIAVTAPAAGVDAGPWEVTIHGL